VAAHEVLASIPVDITESASASGAAYLYDMTGEDIELAAYLKASNAEAGDQFGGAIGLADGLIAIGAPNEDSNAGGVNADASDDNAALESGAIYVFGADCSLLAEGAVIPGC